MAIRWSSIHEQLGEPPRDLDYDLLTAAVAHRLGETESLDWKSALPGREEAQLDEFAKDVAAMANTRGGLLVYGVAEERGTGRAKEFAEVDASEAAQRRLRQLAAARVRPFISGLSFAPLGSGDGGDTALVLSVPRSPDAPHFIGEQNRLGVPFRSGSETTWMREWEIERAYRERASSRDAEQQNLLALVDEASDHLDMDGRAWITAAVRPRMPIAAVGSPPDAAEVQLILQAAMARSLEILPVDRHGVRQRLFHEVVGSPRARVGLRRWVFQSGAEGPESLSHWVHIELHHDGSLVLAAHLASWGAEVLPDRHQVVCPLVESFAADLVGLAEAYVRRLGGQGPMSFRLALLRSDDRPFGAIVRQQHGPFFSDRMHRVAGSRDVRRFVPIVAEMPMTDDVAGLRETAKDLAKDVLHQFGVAQLGLLAG